MDTLVFAAALAWAVVAPILAIAYLRSILTRVLRSLCGGDGSDGSAEFWIRCATLLAVTGSVLLVVVFGEFDPGTPLPEVLRRAVALTMGGVFASVAVISRNVWNAAHPPFPLTPAAIAAAAVRENAA